MEGTLRRMKKILVTLFQLAVTIALLYWVYHDPNRRAQMVEAIRNAQYHWVIIGILAYVVVEIAAAFRWHVLLKVQGIHLSFARLCGLFLIGTFVISGFTLFHRLPAKFPGREKLIEISAAYHLYARHWRATFVAFGASVVAHLATFTAFLCAAYALGAAVPLVNFFAVMPIERTISALPISFAGIGLREKVLQIMLHGLCGVPEATAILIGSLSFLIILICCLPGAIVYFFYKPSGVIKHVKLREMQEEVAILGHEIGETE